MEPLQLQPLSSLSEFKAIVPGSVLSQKLDAEVLLLAADVGHYYGLDETGTRLWEMIADADGRLENVLTSMREEYSSDLDQLEKGLIAFVVMLEHFSLLHLVNDSGERRSLVSA